MRIRRQRSSARSLPRRATRPLARFLPGTPGKALAEDASRATARPAPAKSPPPFACSCQPKPAGQAPAWQHAASRPSQQAPAWRHADLREGPTTAPPQLPACLHVAASMHHDTSGLMQTAFSNHHIINRPGYFKEISRPCRATGRSLFKYGFKEEPAHHFYNDPALGGYIMPLKLDRKSTRLNSSH